MSKPARQINEVIIVNIIPYFLERGPLWYSQNYAKIKNAARAQIWWKDNTLFLEQNMSVKLYEILRRLAELGYAKVQTLGGPGEFAQRGGVLDIFPINSQQPYRVEFSGNKIETISELSVHILKSEKEIQKTLRERQPQDLFYNLKPGDFLVHLDHGIGVFKGYAKQPGGTLSYSPPKPESDEKYFVLEYAKNDKLYVPLSLEEKLSRYIGFETPIIHRLGGTLWFKTKRKARANALALAQELLALYGQRARQRGFQYAADDHLQKELESDFPFIETDDQIKAVVEVKRDMESDRPMDRLICGDVGFGKTEVALRAAFKAVSSGKQVTLLAPTTILANQHFRTFSSRLAKFPVRVELLTRLQSKSQQKKNIKETAEGKIDILIGTHRLLSGDVIFSAEGGSASGGKNLGLAIIDEEQRFGVRQKEKFKELRAQVDILSLTATPIPRTMHLALSGLRDISIIGTPPPGRLPVKTIIEPFSQNIIKQAIEKELARPVRGGATTGARGGQIYYLHNRVETIELVAQQIKKLVPKAKIVTIHGRLPEKKLIKIMDDFGAGDIDVLVATTIIENGLDFPNVNTLLVANASRLGLAQAYQIRGRIGRSHQQAYAYFLYSSKHLTDEARHRLDALKEAEALGSGYQLALRDLEIRGAGNILGREQSGPINTVGLNLYMQMLNEAIEEMKK